jgi:hypothetical protein
MNAKTNLVLCVVGAVTDRGAGVSDAGYKAPGGSHSKEGASGNSYVTPQNPADAP